MKGRAILVGLLCWGVAAGRLEAQFTGGNVSGLITDPSGAAIPQARVVFRDLAMQTRRTLNANLEGFYRAPNLVPGEYDVTVSAASFESQVARLTLPIGAEQELNFALRIGPVDQVVEVESPAEGVGQASSAVGAVVNQKTIDELPLNGRSWTELAALTPGVVAIEAQPSYTSGNPRGNRGFGAQLAISGARPQQNNYWLDGISINDYSNGAPGSAPQRATLLAERMEMMVKETAKLEKPPIERSSSWAYPSSCKRSTSPLRWPAVCTRLTVSQPRPISTNSGSMP